MITEAEFRQKIGRINNMPNGKARVLASELLTREVEQAGLNFQLPEALLNQVEAHTFGDNSTQVFALYSKLLRLWDEHPEYFDEYDQDTLFWQYKWIADGVREFPQISLAQGQALIEDMKRRYQLAGHSLAAVERAKYRWALANNEHDAAEKQRAAWIAFGEDEMDCEGCLVTDTIEWYLRHQEIDEAITVGPAEGGCNREPAGSYLAMAEAHLRRGDISEALSYVKRFEASNQGEEGAVTVTSSHFRLYALLGLYEQAIEVLRRDGTNGLSHKGDPRSQMIFAFDLIEGLSANKHLLDQAINLPQSKTGRDLLDWATATAEPLVEAFDQRSGNDGYRQQLAKAYQASRFADLDTNPAELKNTAEFDSSADVQNEEKLTSAESAPLTVPASDQETSLPNQALPSDPETAEQLRFEDAEELEEAGDFVAAGKAWAEIGRNYQLIEDFEQAETFYARALALLASADADLNLRMRVLEEYLAVCLPQGKTQEPENMLEIIPAEDTSELMGDLKAEHDRQEAYRAAKRAEFQAEIALARDPQQLEVDTLKKVTAAAEAFGWLGAITEATHWFYRAGKIALRQEALDQAEWNFESALEGSRLLHNGARSQKILAELTDVLESTGQSDKAQRLVEDFIQL